MMNEQEINKIVNDGFKELYPSLQESNLNLIADYKSKGLEISPEFEDMLEALLANTAKFSYGQAVAFTYLALKDQK